MKEIEVKKLSYRYKGSESVLSDISFAIEKGESVGIIGANGAGKSTLLKILTGLLDDYEGQICIGGLTVDRKNISEIRKNVGYVFQDSDSQLFMSTVYEDVAFAPRNYGMSESAVCECVEAALAKVHIEDIKDRHIHKLSGGQKKLASIATILSVNPTSILLDEPSTALDPKNRRNLINILNEMDVLKIITSHDLDLILDTCTRTILIADGRIIRDGLTKEILYDRQLLEDNGLELPLSLYNRI